MRREVRLKGRPLHSYLCSVKAVPDAKTVRLSQLPAGRKARIHDHDDSDFRLTLMEMGCVPGEPVWIEMVAPMGDPLAIRIAGYYLSIRKQDAERIWVSLEQ
jgi:ferrous iron transport protein A